MRRTPFFSMAALLLFIIAACTGGSGGDAGNGKTAKQWPDVFTTEDVVLSAGLLEIQPETVDTLSGSVDLSRFGMAGFDDTFELTTPAGADFDFTLTARGTVNGGMVRMALGHVKDGNATVTGGPETLLSAGMWVEGSGAATDGVFVNAEGDGFARMTVHGNVSQQQVLLIMVPTMDAFSSIGIRISIGAVSEINTSDNPAANPRPGMTVYDVYSSNSPNLGLPSIGAAQDHVMIAVNDGEDREDEDFSDDPTRRWLKIDPDTGLPIAGGTAPARSGDDNNWRDHVVDARGNVIAVAYAAKGVLRCELSIDAGISFWPTTIESTPGLPQRVPAVTIGEDYQICIAWWRTVISALGRLGQLVMVEALPDGFDQDGNPTSYTFGAAQVVHSAWRDATPQMMCVQYSEGNDLVIAHAYSHTDRTVTPRMTWAEFRCAVRPDGEYLFTEHLVEYVERIMPTDPHVCLAGSGAGMTIYYAYEHPDGVRLARSSDAGATWNVAHTINSRGAMAPSVHVRTVGTNTVVDLLYLEPRKGGLELRCMHWDNFSMSTPGEVYSVLEADSQPAGATGGLPAGRSVKGVGWLGYQSKLVDDEIVVVVHEVDMDSRDFRLRERTRNRWGQTPLPVAVLAGAEGEPSLPQIDVPGLGDSVPGVEAAHDNQLKVIILE
jgi:hypothetical protein